MSEEECKSIKSASVKTVEMVMSARVTESTMMEISMEVFEVTNLLVDTLITLGNKFPSRRRFKRIRAIERKVNRLFHDVIKYKDARYNDNVILGLAHLIIYWIYDKILQNNKLINSYIRIYLIRCLELLKGKELDYTVILLAIRVLNHLGNTYLSFDKPEDSIPIFEEATQLYLKYTEGKDVYPIPFNILTIFGFEENIKSKILLEEIYITVLKRLMKASEETFQADECTLILHKLKYLTQQLMYIPLTIEYLKFITEFISVSEFFLLRNHFTEARNCLAVAFWMLRKLYLQRYKPNNMERFLGEKVMINVMCQNMNKKIVKYWGRYGLVLLRSSVKQLLHNEEENESLETNHLKLESSTEINKQLKQLTLFSELKEDIQIYTNAITDKYLVHYTDASDVFLRVLYWFDKAKTYYTPDKDKIEYVTIVQDISKVHKYFTYYEQDLDKQMVLYSARINSLEKVLKILNKRCDYNILKQIWIELAIIYSTLFGILVQTNQISGVEPHLKLAPHLDDLVKHSMLNFQLYLS